MQDLLEMLVEERVSLEKILKEAEKEIKKAPEGSLHVIQKPTYVQFYHRLPNMGSGKSGIYIPKKNIALAAALAQKKYDKSICQIIRNRLDLIQNLIRIIQEDNLQTVYNELPEALQIMVNPRGLSDEQYRKTWESMTFHSSLSFSENDPEIFSDRGERVRSKSEKIIADKLFHMNISYRYECPLLLDDGEFASPDFTVLNLRLRMVYFWEHNGRMDDPKYVNRFIYKNTLYAKNGMHPGSPLIYTYETSDWPLDSRILDGILQKFIL